MPTEKEYNKAIKTIVEYELENYRSDSTIENTLRLSLNWINISMAQWLRKQPNFAFKVWMVEIEKEGNIYFGKEKIKSKFLLHEAKASCEKIKLTNEE